MRQSSLSYHLVILKPGKKGLMRCITYEENNMTGVMGPGDSVEIILLLGMVDRVHHVIWLLGLRLSPCSFPHGAKSVEKLKLYEKYPSTIKCDPSPLAYFLRKVSLWSSHMRSHSWIIIKWPYRMLI